MSTDFEHSALWRRTLGAVTGDGWDRQREALKSAYLQFRSVVAQLANDISVSMPMFTDHSIEHIDSLWDMASLLVHDEYPLNPAEAFVLGGAFLLHDLGMGLVALPGGLDQIKADPLYEDFLSLARARIKSSSTELSSEVIEANARDEAVATLLRLRHAKQAEHLVGQPFVTDNGQEFRLLENTSLRLAFGPLIGKIAHSHWFDVDELSTHFGQVIGSLPIHPGEWVVDPLKIACILRLSDAAHIDNRRAPTYLHAFRRPTGESRDHWYFQQRLMRPLVKNDRLEYTSPQPFESNEASAWWLAYETIGMIDRELRRVDALCADIGKDRFLVRAVAGAESPIRLTKYIPTTGWRPIDARLHVSSVNDVIARLGGKELYGNRPEVAVRELIANGADAVRARATQYGGSDLNVTVRLLKEGADYWLLVEDKGIGMGPEKLVSSLTDFGLSTWQSTAMATDYPGLIAKGFKSTGKFGIGFFSIFMLADYVEVRSLKHFESPTSTHVLVFNNGVQGRPILRVADDSEMLRGGGTIVRAKLKCDPLSDEGLFRTDAIYKSRTRMFRSLVLEICALADADLYVQGPEEGSSSLLLSANDWKWLEPRELFKRLYPSEERLPLEQSMYDAYEDVFAKHVRNLHDEKGDIVGRAILAAGLESLAIKDLWWWPSPKAKTYVGGFVADSIYDCLGAFLGEPVKADRFSAFPLASMDELRNWAESQAELVRRSRYATARTRYGAGDLARSVGANVPLLPCGFIKLGEINPIELTAFVEKLDRIILIPSYELYIFHREDGTVAFIDPTRGRSIELPDDAIVFEHWCRWFFPEEISKRPLDERFADYGEIERNKWNPRRWWHQSGKVGSAALILDAALTAWNCEALGLVDKFEKLDITQEGDSRLCVPCIDEPGSILVGAYKLTRPGTIIADSPIRERRDPIL